MAADTSLAREGILASGQSGETESGSDRQMEVDEVFCTLQ